MIVTPPTTDLPYMVRIVIHSNTSNNDHTHVSYKGVDVMCGNSSILKLPIKSMIVIGSNTSDNGQSYFTEDFLALYGIVYRSTPALLYRGWG